MTGKPAPPAGSRPNRIRMLERVLVGAVAVMVLVCVGMVAGPAINDARISADTGWAVARVQEVGVLRTYVEFTAEDGTVYSPDAGLLYPIGLSEGQRVRVEYSRSNPSLVRVEGRRWTLALWPAGSTLLVTLLVAAVVWVVARRVSGPWRYRAIGWGRMGGR